MSLGGCNFCSIILAEVDRTFLQWTYETSRTSKSFQTAKGLLHAAGLYEPVPLATDSFFGGECRLQSLRFNLFWRERCEIPVSILKLIVMDWADSSLQELHEITVASVNSLSELKPCPTIACQFRL